MNKLVVTDKDRILIIAPHPDDESIGCGGLLSIYGPQCDILLLTNGNLGNYKDSELNSEQLMKIRKKEFENVIKIYGVKKVFDLSIDDHSVVNNFQKIIDFDISNYTKVFLPSRWDRHIDHRYLYACMKLSKYSGQFFEYEVWTALPSYTHYLDISEVIEIKNNAISMYKSQLKSFDYIKMVNGLNSFRGGIEHVSYAEAYNCEKKISLKVLSGFLPFWSIEFIYKIKK